MPHFILLIVLCVSSLVVSIQASTLFAGQAEWVGSGSVPLVLSLMLCALVVAEFVSVKMKVRAQTAVDDTRYLTAGLTLLSATIFLLLVPWFGFLWPSLLLLPLLSYLMGSRSLIGLGLLSIGWGLLVYFVFLKVLQVPLPAGELL